MAKIAFFECKNWETDYFKNHLPQDELFFFDGNLSKNNLPQDQNFDIISVFVGSAIGEEVVNNFPNLKLITTRSTGFDHVNLAAAQKGGVKTGYVPGYGDNTVAEYAFALILNLSRKIFEGYDRIKEKGQFNFEGLQGFDLKDKTIGVIGTGRIGRHSVKIAKGFDMNVLAFDAYPNKDLEKELGFKYVSLDELLANSDVISLHAPYNESTHHLINANNIGKIKKGALLINTARGGLIETETLIKALSDGQLGGFGADVLEEEGILKDEKSFILSGQSESHNLKTVLADHVLIDMPNVVITPHNAANTKEAFRRIMDIDIENIKSFIEKGETKYPIPVK